MITKEELRRIASLIEHAISLDCSRCSFSIRRLASDVVNTPHTYVWVRYEAPLGPRPLCIVEYNLEGVPVDTRHHFRDMLEAVDYHAAQQVV